MGRVRRQAGRRAKGPCVVCPTRLSSAAVWQETVRVCRTAVGRVGVGRGGVGNKNARGGAGGRGSSPKGVVWWRGVGVARGNGNQQRQWGKVATSAGAAMLVVVPSKCAYGAKRCKGKGERAVYVTQKCEMLAAYTPHRL